MDSSAEKFRRGSSGLYLQSNAFPAWSSFTAVSPLYGRSLRYANHLHVAISHALHCFLVVSNTCYRQAKEGARSPSEGWELDQVQQVGSAGVLSVLISYTFVSSEYQPRWSV